MPRRSVARPILFSLGLGGAAYFAAAAYTNTETEHWMRKLGAGSVWRMGGQPGDREMMRAQRLEAAKDAQDTLNTLPQRLSFLPSAIATPIVRTYILTSEYLLNTPAAQLAPAGLIAGMGAVFLAWRVPRWEPFMRTWFLHRPVVFTRGMEWRNCVTLFTSTISHQSFAHFAFNSIALYSFGSAAYTYLSLPSSPSLPSVTHTPHFVSFLLLAGLFSSLSSHLFTNLVRLPRLLRTLSSPARLSSAQALAAHQAILPSLGASGAIYAALSMTALAFPDSHVSIIFLPFISMPIGLGVAGMVAVDLVGLIRGWRMFDHVAHLGGAFFGALYYAYGRPLWARARELLGAQPRVL
ncbi:hypothetical protein Q5752_000181 [Cryptotrichosporon argae]